MSQSLINNQVMMGIPESDPLNEDD